jgi:hypothetical protein
MYREVAAHLGAWACALGHAYLADDDLAGLCRLAAGYLDPEPLPGTIMIVFAGASSLNLGHLLSFPFDYDEFAADDLIFPVIDHFVALNILKAQTIVTQKA